MQWWWKSKVRGTEEYERELVERKKRLENQRKEADTVKRELQENKDYFTSAIEQALKGLGRDNV
jgi:hypothetical protein